MLYTDEQLIKLHAIEKDILKEVKRVCLENNIVYFVDWGTLLGVIRHNGFIPWDDDIDISMPRESFERFLKIAPHKLNNGYVLQHFTVDNKTPSYCAKVRKDGTRFVELCNLNIPIHQGVFIDIFPIDFVPDDPCRRLIYRMKATFLKQLFISKVITEPSYSKTKLKKLFLTMIRTSVHILLKPISRKFLYSMLDKHLRQYNDKYKRKLTCIGTARGEHDFESVFPLKTAYFEDLVVFIPNKPEVVLKKEYGEWKCIPSPEKRVTHSPEILEI